MNKIISSLNWFIFIFGVFFVSAGGYIYLKSEKIKTWPTTNGAIITSEIVTNTEKGSKRFIPEVTYEYQVGSTRYKGDKIGIGKESHESYAKRVIGNYPPGKNVTVFYNIKDPSEAFLDFGITPIIYYFLGIGFVFILSSTSMMYFKDAVLNQLEKLFNIFHKPK